MSSLIIKDMYKKYGNKVIFEEFNLEISEGEFVVITGASGSGKTTLLNIIGLLDTMDSGKLELLHISDPSIDEKSGRLLLRTKISYIFQNFALVDSKSVMYNLMIPLNIIPKISRAEKKRKIAQVLEEVGLTGYEHKKVYELSGGEQQRVSFAMAILKNPDLILADEPTGSLDIQNRDSIMKLFKKLHKQGKTVIIVTHDPEISYYADRVVVI